MSRRYDSRTTTFSPEGRIFQVEYAMEAINNAAATLGVKSAGGLVMAADIGIRSPLMDSNEGRQKIYKITDHIYAAVAGWSADANVLLSDARQRAIHYEYEFGNPIPVKQLVTRLCDFKQGYTQYGGLRPFGVSFLFGGWDDEQGFQLYNTDPAGNFIGWNATAIGSNSASAMSVLKQEWDEDIDLETGTKLAVKALLRCVENPKPEQAELMVMSMNDDGSLSVDFANRDKIDSMLKTAIEDREQQANRTGR